MISFSPLYWQDVQKVINLLPDISALRSKHILITGATGMIGSTIADVLLYLNNKNGYNMQVYLAGRDKDKAKKRFSLYQEKKDYIFIQYNALGINQNIPSVDYIIHGASNADPVNFAKSPVETMLANIQGLYSLLEIGNEKKIKRLLYISSGEIYGNQVTNMAYGEADYGYVDILKARACYPSSKRAAETLCVAFQEEYGLDSVIVRPCHIYGPSISDTDSRVSAYFTRCAASHVDIIMKSPGMQLRSYCYTLDCAAAIITVLCLGETGQAYNIASEESTISIRALGEKFAAAANIKITFITASENERKGYNLMDNSVLNANKLRLLGWHPCFSIDEGVARTLQFFSA